MQEEIAGALADWKAVDAAMIRASSIARDVGAYRHAKLSAVRAPARLPMGRRTARRSTS